MADRDQTVELLHGLGHLHMRHGQRERGLVLLLIAARLAPQDEAVLRTLADAFLASGSAQSAMTTIEQLEATGADQPELDLLRSHAYWLAGSDTKARQTFQTFLEHQRQS